jgi:transcriptional regulator with XRE-family HTH domain
MDKVSPEVKKRWGLALKKLRDERNLTQTALGRRLGLKGTVISNLECGVTKPSKTLLRQLDQTLETGGELARLWKAMTDDGQLPWLGRIAELEQEALSILEFQPLLIPSLLQTEPYAEAVMRAVTPWESDSLIQESLRERMERARRFQSGSVPIMVVVIGVAALDNLIGDHAVMVEQIKQLRSLASEERITLQVLTCNRHPGLVGSFKVIAPNSGPEVVYADSAIRGQFLDAQAEVGQFKLRFGRLQAMAQPPDQSLSLLEEKIEGFE